MTDFLDFFQQVGNWYMTRQMVKPTKLLIKEMNAFLEFKAAHFYVHPQIQNVEDQRLVLEPGLNIDREGSGKKEETELYWQYARKLDSHITNMRAAYRTYRLSARRALGM
ncbi:MAG TPA: hypothetical protein VI729_09035 [Anaerolineales bacterium]|nr:hypothetical protein [Anaerolineales bacterium]